MKRIVTTGAVLLLVLFLLPLLLLDPPQSSGEPTAQQPLPVLPMPAVTPSGGSEGEAGADAGVTLRVAMADGSVSEMTMEDYLWSVVAAEMPASFEPEALKAQAVTARTYALWKMEAGESDHPHADLCTDITCCQAFASPQQAAEEWGNAAAAYTRKIRSAVEDTDGQIITYGDQPIQAVFFSSAAGRTEDAVAVWGNAVPYLVGVDSPEGADVPDYRTDVTLSAAEAKNRILSRYPGADLSGPAEQWFCNRTLTASGRVDTMDVGGITLKGTQVRALFDLRSTCFTVEAGAQGITFRVTGYGHGVGMSQYGANTLAKQGKTCEEILNWYYTGVEIG